MKKERSIPENNLNTVSTTHYMRLFTAIKIATCHVSNVSHVLL